MSIRLRLNPRVLALVLGLWAFSYAGSASANIDLLALPEPARVIDQTHTLTDAEIKVLDARLERMEQRRAAQLAIVMVPTTYPETIEQYAARTHEAWRPSRKGAENYLLLFVAKNDRQVRIEVGFDHELAVSDKTTDRLVNETLVPAFKEGRFYEGISRTTELLDGLMDGKPLESPATLGLNKETLQSWGPWVVFALALLIGRAIFRRRKTATAEALIPPQNQAATMPSTEVRRGWRPWGGCP